MRRTASIRRPTREALATIVGQGIKVGRRSRRFRVSHGLPGTKGHPGGYGAGTHLEGARSLAIRDGVTHEFSRPPGQAGRQRVSGRLMRQYRHMDLAAEGLSQVQALAAQQRREVSAQIARLTSIGYAAPAAVSPPDERRILTIKRDEKGKPRQVRKDSCLVPIPMSRPRQWRIPVRW